MTDKSSRARFILQQCFHSSDPYGMDPAYTAVTTFALITQIQLRIGRLLGTVDFFGYLGSDSGPRLILFIKLDYILMLIIIIIIICT